MKRIFTYRSQWKDTYIYNIKLFDNVRKLLTIFKSDVMDEMLKK